MIVTGSGIEIYIDESLLDGIQELVKAEFSQYHYFLIPEMFLVADAFSFDPHIECRG